LIIIWGLFTLRLVLTAESFSVGSSLLFNVGLMLWFVLTIAIITLGFLALSKWLRSNRKRD